jgi:hypothetical protein
MEEAPPPTEVELSYSAGAIVALVVYSIFSLGLGLIRFLIGSGARPRRVDQQGVTLRNGTRFAWSELKKIQGVLVVDRRGFPRGGHWQLDFAGGSVLIDPSRYSSGYEALQLIKRVTGRDPNTG